MLGLDLPRGFHAWDLYDINIFTCYALHDTSCVPKYSCRCVLAQL